jgi:hypothetical protein
MLEILREELFALTESGMGLILIAGKKNVHVFFNEEDFIVVEKCKLLDFTEEQLIQTLQENQNLLDFAIKKKFVKQESSETIEYLNYCKSYD